MCECLDYEDGSRHMCPVCVDLHEKLLAEMRGRPTNDPALTDEVWGAFVAGAVLGMDAAGPGECFAPPN